MKNGISLEVKKPVMPSLSLGSTKIIGQNGATFYPEVSEDGIISWTNDKGLDNPKSVNIKGKDGADGKNGADGEDGYSPNISVSKIPNGNRVTITDKDNVEHIDILNGANGQNGADGVGIKSVEKTATNGEFDTYTFNFTDGKTFSFTIKNGKDGEDGADGRGISSIVKSSTNGLIDNYTINFTDGSKTTFSVTNGKNGVDGTDGKDGTPATHEWQGTTLVITSASGTSSANLKGERGIQGIQGEKGDPFFISKVYNSVAEMHADYSNNEVKVGQFVVIETGNVNDEDNAKLFIKGNTSYEFLTDLSGAQGMQGPAGVQGEQGDQGPAGVQGVGIHSIAKTDTQGIRDIYTITLTDGRTATFSVTNGTNGNDGVSVTNASIDSNGNLVISLSNGNELTLGKVVGSNGKDGADGTSVTITRVDENTSDGGVSTIFFSDGNSINIKNGATGGKGKDGTNGKDYVLTEADKIEIASLVDETTIIPDYWISELENKADAIQTAMEKAGKNKSAFLWYTDAHWVNGNSKVSPKLLNYLYMNTPMNKVNFGGDIIGDTLLATREEMKYLYEWRKAIKDLPNHHSVFGNHDMFNLDTVDYEDNNYRYAFLLAPEETPDQVWGDGNYYYIDNPAEKTRYLYIAYLIGDGEAMMKQGQFICDAIKAVPEGWHIVSIAHRWWQYSTSSTPTTGSISAYEAEILSVFDAYNARETRSGSNYFYTQDFSQGKGKVEFCIGGHIHVDYDIKSEGGIPIIITTADANQNRVPNSTVDCGTVGTITEAAVYGIVADYNDPNNTKITVVGVGRGTSRVISESQTAYPYAISDVEYFGDKTVGATIDVSKFSFTVHYTNGSSVEKTGISSVSPSTIQEGQYVYTLLYSEMGVDTPCDFTIVSETAVVTNLLNLDRAYVTGTAGEFLGKSHLDESKAYTNVAYGSNEFVAKPYSVSNITENGVTLKEGGKGGICVAYPIHLIDIGTQAYRLTFDYSGAGKVRTFYKYAKADGTITTHNVLYINDTAGASGSADVVIPASTGHEWLIVYLGSNTSNTKTFTNVSLTEA